ncbi:MAG: magnesium-translocating P-type ATPase [Coriobacteriia bacterium]|nr:magnesium-translocating P-type ATPase [Coriobacteriia bacterium]MCL2537460.1 magnesium-translocating P-type ATPase [Coriobacteriia bacterium]
MLTFIKQLLRLKSAPDGLANGIDNRPEAQRRLMAGAKSAEHELFVQYNVAAYDGHDDEAVQTSRERYGANVIAHTERLTVLKQLFEAFVNPFTIVLFVLAIVSFFTDYVFAAADEQDLTAVIIITTMVTVSGLLRFVQESRSGKAAEALAEMVETTIDCVRNSHDSEVPVDEIVVGDIVKLAAGDIVPGDMRILKAKDLFISESSLTGESEPVEKFGAEYTGISENPLDSDNLVFMGSNVISGSATALVLAVGRDTYFGQVAAAVQGKEVQTSFEKGVNSVSWVLIRFMLIMVPIVLVLTGFTKGDWTQAFLFALAVAVGLTPEMLPMIVSANLAKGAVAMSKKRVIVKNLNSIQNFGSMNVLCTDKTGTLTEDRIILEYSLNVRGEEDKRVLRHGFLNSYFQTGFRNLLDRAIIKHGDDHDLSDLRERYQKVDEIPFDFSRRRMSVVVEDHSGKRQMITKGAIEEMLLVSKYVEIDGRIEPLTPVLAKDILETVNRYNAEGMRVLGISQRTHDLPAVGEFCVNTEADMVLIGYLAFLDPPKDSARAAIEVLHEYGVDVKVLTGDNDAVTRKVCRDVGIKVDDSSGKGGMLLGTDLENMSDEQLDAVVMDIDVFAKLSPAQKVRIVGALRRIGNTVGFLGDGINDAAAMKESDVGISVDTAVDIAKESANIILLEKDLMVLEKGVIEGRKVYGNTIKYIKMTVSSNLGNMFSVLAAAAFLPFLPMLPLQILVLNLIYDISCTAMPWDNVDEEFLRKPRGWDASSVQRFMVWLGPTSSIFDIATFFVMFFWFGPAVFGGSFFSLDPAAQIGFIALFHAAWFVASLWTQTLVIHALRTPKLPFLQSRASWPVIGMTTLGLVIGTVLPYTPLGERIGFVGLPAGFFVFLVVMCVLYFALVQVVKGAFIKKYGELL